jgi:hypothetical protein
VHEYKTITRLDSSKAWRDCFEWFLGRSNWEWFVQPGTGSCDTDEPNTDPDTDPIKLQSIDYANNVRKVVPNSSLPPRFTQVEVLDFSRPPVLVNGVWKIWQGEKLVEFSWEQFPYLLVVLTMCGHTKDKVSYGPVSDKGFPGGRGDVIRPNVMRYPAIHQTAGLMFYNLPFKTKLYRQSLIVEGELVTGLQGVEVTIDALCFLGADTYGRVTIYASWFDKFIARLPFLRQFARVVSQNWYLLDKMQIRGSLDDWSLGGTWRDRLCYSDAILQMICSTPIMGWRR